MNNKNLVHLDVHSWQRYAIVVEIMNRENLCKVEVPTHVRGFSPR
jgi:hypothetical protein